MFLDVFQGKFPGSRFSRHVFPLKNVFSRRVSGEIPSEPILLACPSLKAHSLDVLCLYLVFEVPVVQMVSQKAARKSMV